MKIVDTLKHQPSANKRVKQGAAGPKKLPKKANNIRPDISESDLRKRIDKELAKRNKLPGKAHTAGNAKEAMSGTGLNDPNDPTTKHKLESALKAGMVQWSDKERQALEKILGQS